MRRVAIAVLAAGSLLVAGRDGGAHGLTNCVGTVTYDDGQPLVADLRFGVGVLHKFVDLNSDAAITDEEWTSATPSLRDLFSTGIVVRTGTGETTPSKLELTLTSGAEIQVVAHFDGATSMPVDFLVPALTGFPSTPVIFVSEWHDGKIVGNPQLLWYDQALKVGAGK